MSDEETTDQVTESEPLDSVAYVPSEEERLARADHSLPAIPGYEVLAELGRGGMGVVYLARQLSLNRRVALKMIRSGELASPQERERFLIEAEALARLQHAGIVQVYEVGTFNDCPYFALEYVEGGSLAAYRDGEPQPAREAAEVVCQLARAMQHAHERGIVHRDLKPANVLLASGASNGPGSNTPGPLLAPLASLKIADFGLAKLIDVDRGATATGAILGTPSYASPEQAAGQARDAAAPADIHALGVILYEMLTGRPPFKAATALETLEMVRTQEPVPPRQLMPRVPRDLDTICLKCLHKTPARRYSSAAELADDLDRFLKGEPIHARPVGTFERVLKWSRRRPALTTLIVVCLVALFAGAFGSWTYQRDLSAALLESQRSERKAVAESENAQKSLDKANRSLYASQLTHISTIWQHDPWQSLELLRDPERCPEDLRDFVWGYYHRHGRRQVWTTKGHKGEAKCVAFSAGGSLLFSGGPEGIFIWTASSGKSQGPFEGPCGKVACLRLTPDGRTLAAGCMDGKIIFWDTITRKQQRTFSQDDRGIISLAFSPDGSHLAASGYGGTFRVWDLSTGLDQKPLNEDTLGPTSVAWSPDGGWLALGSNDHQLHILDVRGTQKQQTYKVHDHAIVSVAFSPDGKVLASVDCSPIVNQPSHLRLWRADLAGRWRSAAPVPVRTGLYNGAAFSPDSATLAAIGSDNSVRLIDVALNQERVILRGHSDRVASVAFSPNGRLLAAGCIDGSIHVWNAQGGRDLEPLTHDALYYTAAAFSPDGKVLAIGGGSVVVGKRHLCSLILRDWPTGQSRRIFTTAGTVFDLAWAPDGQALACTLNDKVLLYKSGSQDPPEEWTLARAQVRKLAFSADGRWLAAATNTGQLVLRDCTTGKTVSLLGGPEKMRWSGLSLSPDGKTLAASGFLLNEPGEIVLWDLDTGQIRQTLRGHTGNVTCVLFSPDGNTLASSGAKPDNSVRLWNADGTLRTVLPRQTAGISKLAFDKRGRVLASASQDGQIRLWDPKYGQERLTLIGHLEQVQAIAFHPSTNCLISTSFDKTLRVWQADELSGAK